MKNLLLILLYVFALNNVNAADLPSLIIDTDKTIVLDFNDWKSTTLNVSITDMSGFEIYEDTILPTKKRTQKFNLKNLPKGYYNVVVSDEYKSVKYDVKVSNTSVVSVSEGSTSYFPQITTTREVIDINLLALNKKVNISLMDEKGNSIYNEVINNDPAVTKRLNIANLDRGNYTLRVNIGDASYTELIRLKK
jgi:hypothetical protein